MVDHIFVYGTLMHSIPSPMSRFLSTRSVWVGKGSLPGILLDLGRYPGLVPGQDDGPFVQGEVLQLSAFETNIAVLDEYEGTASGTDGPPEYERRLATAILANGASVAVWVYVFLGDPSPFPVIAGGDYLPYWQQHPAHRKFSGQ